MELALKAVVLAHTPLPQAAAEAPLEQRLRDACADLGLTVTAWFESSIAGGDGNHEFFICAHNPGETANSE